MTKRVVLLDRGRFAPEDIEQLQHLGFDYVLADSVDSIRMVPTQEDRRFTAAVAAMQGLLARSMRQNGMNNDHVNHANVRLDEPWILVGRAVEYADALLKELAK